MTLLVQIGVGTIGVAGRSQEGHDPPKFLENIVILCFERRFSKQNSVIRLKSSILSPPNFLVPPKFLGWIRHCWESVPTAKKVWERRSHAFPPHYTPDQTQTRFCHFSAVSLFFVSFVKNSVVASWQSDFFLLLKLIKIFSDLLSRGAVQTCASTQ